MVSKVLVDELHESFSRDVAEKRVKEIDGGGILPCLRKHGKYTGAFAANNEP